MKLFCDNKVVIDSLHNPVHHDRPKHMEIDKHFIKENIESGIIFLTYVLTNNKLLISTPKDCQERVLKT